ncbi:MAG: M14 family metallocarboxypeptidase [Verrucomicrobiota bacterium]
MTSSKSKRAVDPPPCRHLRCHDPAWLAKRWRVIAPKAGLIVETFAKSHGHPLLHVATKKPAPENPWVYFSAGIHGDEPASTEALLAWVERNAPLARSLNLRIFPCLNPWGLENNCRLDADGRDLNRCYRNPSHPPLAAHSRLAKKNHYDLAIVLHEDFDAQGVYVYETSPLKPYLGEKIIAAMSCHIPPDPRRRIDSSRAKNGVIRRRITRDLMPDWPEAFLLHFHCARRVFTIETPSEFQIDTRVEAHIAAIDAALEGAGVGD